jgi:hypothetical protein
MRPSSYWPLAVLIGVAIGGGVFVLASNLAFARVATIVYVLATDLFLRESFALRERFDIEEWSMETLLPWSGLCSVTTGLIGLLFAVIVPLPFVRAVAVLITVVGAMLVMLNIGIGMALIYVDAADTVRGERTDGIAAGRTGG